MIQTRKKWKTLAILCNTMLLDMIGIGIVIPVLSIMFTRVDSPLFLLPPSFSQGQGYMLFGFFISLYPLGQFLSTPILGQLSDRYGRKKILLFCFLGSTLAFSIFAMGIMNRFLPFIFVSRFISGIMGGNTSIVLASAADISPPEKRAQTFGLLMSILGIGFVIGPFLGGNLSDPNLLPFLNIASPFWLASMLHFLNFFCILFFFKDTIVIDPHAPPLRLYKCFTNIIKVFQLPQIRPFFIVNSTYMLGFSFFTSFMGVFLIQRFDVNQIFVGNYMAYNGMWIMIAQLIFLRIFLYFFKDYNILRFSYFSTALIFVNYLWFPNVYYVFFFGPFYITSYVLCSSIANGLLSRSVSKKIQGEIMGINSSVMSFAQAFPPLISGFLAAQLDYSVPLMFSVILFFTAGVLFNLLYTKKFIEASPVSHD